MKTKLILIGTAIISLLVLFPSNKVTDSEANLSNITNTSVTLTYILHSDGIHLNPRNVSVFEDKNNNGIMELDNPETPEIEGNDIRIYSKNQGEESVGIKTEVVFDNLTPEKTYSNMYMLINWEHIVGIPNNIEYIALDSFTTLPMSKEILTIWIIILIVIASIIFLLLIGVIIYFITKYRMNRSFSSYKKI